MAVLVTVLVAVVAGAAALAIWVRAEGIRLYVVHTGSMTPTYQPGDLVVDGRPTSYGVGSVITFRHSDVTTDVVTHRVVAVSAAGITTKGDANRTPDAWTIRPDQVRGTVRRGLPDLGYVVVYLQQPAGVASVLSGAVSVLLLWGLCFPQNVVEGVPTHRARRLRKVQTAHSLH